MRVARDKDANAAGKAEVEAGHETSAAIVLDRGYSRVGRRITDHVQAIAGSGVNFISVGALTHSARAVDMGLDFED